MHMKRLATLLLAVALTAMILQPVYGSVNIHSGNNGPYADGWPIPLCPPSGCSLVAAATVLADASRMAPILPRGGLSG